MSNKKINLLQFFNINKQELIDNSLKNDCGEDKLKYFISRLESFDEAIENRIYTDYIIAELLDTFPDISLIYSKQDIANNGERNCLMWQALINNGQYKIIDIITNSTNGWENSILSKYLYFLFKDMSVSLLCKMLLTDGFPFKPQELQEISNLVNSDHYENNITHIVSLWKQMCKGIDFDKIKVKISSNIFNPIHQASNLSSFKKRSVQETYLGYFYRLMEYIEFEWFINLYPEKFKAAKDSFQTAILEVEKYSFLEWLFMHSNHDVGSQTTKFFDYVLSQELAPCDESVILEFFSNKGASDDIMITYDTYKKTHSTAREIKFMPEKEFPLQFALLPRWNENKLRNLLCYLQKPNIVNGNTASFVSNDTTPDDFLYAFGVKEVPEEDYKGIKWTGNHNNVDGTRKKQILELLVLMGYDYTTLINKRHGIRRIVESVFNVEYKPNNIPKLEDLCGEAYDELSKIVERARR